MPSKKSKKQNSPSPWKVEFECSEEKLISFAHEFARELQKGDRVLLEGPMGAGKSTFARAVLEGLKIEQPAEGSPTFSIANEYSSAQGDLIHIDFYRMEHESELENRGILSYYWEREAIVLSEWLSNWPQLRASILKTGRCFEVQIAFVEGTSHLRKVKMDCVTDRSTSLPFFIKQVT